MATKDKPEEQETPALRGIKYLGRANRRMLTRANMRNLGFEAPKDLVWDRSNGFMLSVEEIGGEEVADRLAKIDGFKRF